MVENSSNTNDPTTPPKRKRGRPTKENRINWEEHEHTYVTTNLTIAQMQPAVGCSMSRILHVCAERKWVAKRAEFQRKQKDKAIQISETQGANDLAREIDSVSKLATGAIGRIAQRIREGKFKDVQCECGRVHRIDLGSPDISVSDLVALYKLRSHLKGDPEYVVGVETDTKSPKDMSKEELVEKFEETLRETAAFVLDD